MRQEGLEIWNWENADSSQLIKLDKSRRGALETGQRWKRLVVLPIVADVVCHVGMITCKSEFLGQECCGLERMTK